MSFFDRKFDVLHRLEELEIQFSFRVQGERISVRLGDANHVVWYGPEGVDGGLLQPDGDAERVRDAMALVFEICAPYRIVSPRLLLQWLEPIDAPYPEARHQEAANLFGGALPGLSEVDTAMFAVGQLAGDLPGSVELEWGVVEADEAPARLARQIGQLAHHAEPEAPPEVWPIDGLPPVAFFLDSAWYSARNPELESSAVFETWDNLNAVADQVATAFYRRATVRSDA